MSISVSKVVNVDFKVAEQTVATGSYNKTLLMSTDATVRFKEYNTLAEVEVDFNNTTPEYDAAELYFNNGGQVLVIGQIDTGESLLQAVQAVELVFTDFIFVAFVDKDNDAVEAQALVTDFDARVAPNKRIACFTVSDANAKTTATTDLMSVLAAANLKSAAAKYTSTGEHDGVLIGAYFSKVDLNGVESIQDYNFTSEVGPSAESLTDAEYDQLIAKNYNFVATIGNFTLNWGGNIVSGVGLETIFGTIALENDVTEAAFDTVVDKQYFTDAGSNNIITAIKDAMVRYVTNGFIAPDSTYLGEDQVINYNGQDFPTIRNGQTLSLGYLVFAIPVANVSAADRAARKLPPISVFINARGSIRRIDINGEVEQ